MLGLLLLVVDPAAMAAPPVHCSSETLTREEPCLGPAAACDRQFARKAAELSKELSCPASCDTVTLVERLGETQRWRIVLSCEAPLEIKQEELLPPIPPPVHPLLAEEGLDDGGDPDPDWPISPFE